MGWNFLLLLVGVGKRKTRGEEMARLNYPTSFRSNARMSLTKFVNDSCDPVVSRDCFLSSIGPISRQNRATCSLLTTIFPFFRFKILKHLVLGFRTARASNLSFEEKRASTPFFFFSSITGLETKCIRIISSRLSIKS